MLLPKQQQQQTARLLLAVTTALIVACYFVTSADGAPSASGSAMQKPHSSQSSRQSSNSRRQGYQNAVYSRDHNEDDDDDALVFVTAAQRRQRLMTLRAQLGQNASMYNWSQHEIKPYEWETILLQYLFSESNYNSEARPAVVKNEPVIVRLDMVLLKINELVEKDQEIVVSGFLKINWTDVRLQWDPNDFGGIEWMITQALNVWLPDIALINSNDVYAVTRDSRFPVTITSNGQVLYVPAGKIHARCELDLRFFPFDYQICYYRFESWVYSAESVTINGFNFTIDPNHYVQNHQWEIIDSFVISKEVTYESIKFSRVDFYLLLRRKSLFFITYTIFPCLALSTLQIFSHMLPFTESERINFATTTLIAFSVFHVAIVEQMPQSSESIPLLAIYVDSLMILIGLSLIECFVMMNWLAKIHFTLPPPKLWWLVVEKWGSLLCLGSAGTYWRRNYLKIYAHVNARLQLKEERRRLLRLRRMYRDHHEEQLKQNKNNKNNTDNNAENQHLHQFTYRKSSKAELAVLSRIAQRWGYSDWHIAPLEEDSSPNNRREGKSGKPLLKVSKTQETDIPMVTIMSNRPSSSQNKSPGHLVREAINKVAKSQNNQGRGRTKSATDQGCDELEFFSRIDSASPTSIFSSPAALSECCPNRDAVASPNQMSQYDNYSDPTKIDPLTLLNFLANRQPLMSTSPPRLRELDRIVQSECGSVRLHGDHSHQHQKQCRHYKDNISQDDDSRQHRHHHRHHHHHHHHHHPPPHHSHHEESECQEPQQSPIYNTPATSLKATPVLKFAQSPATRIDRSPSVTSSATLASLRHRLSCTVAETSMISNSPMMTPMMKLKSEQSSSSTKPYSSPMMPSTSRSAAGATAASSSIKCQLCPDPPSSSTTASQAKRRHRASAHPIQPDCDVDDPSFDQCLIADELSAALTNIHEQIADISAAVTSHELKRECIGIWTTFITVIDRVMSFLLLLLCCLMPTYLFLVFPEKLDISHLKAAEQQAAASRQPQSESPQSSFSFSFS